MGWWSAYFFAKLLLYIGGYIDFDAWWNLGFAAFTALPPKNDRQRLAKNMIASVASVALLYHDSWLPPLARVASQTTNLSAFSLPYVVELLGRFFNWRVMLQILVMLIIYTLLRRKLRMSTFAFIAIIGVIVMPQGLEVLRPTVAAAVTKQEGVSIASVDARNLRPEALTTLMNDFYQTEQQRLVRFTQVAQDATPFDIILLHVCSLSWDDLQYAKQLDNPLFKRFDIVLTGFNSAASYSGPAAIRLLRGNCGQTPHNKLYDNTDHSCLVMDGLQDAGFEPHWLMNHDGHFGNFFGDVRDRGGMPVPLEEVSGAQVAQRSFDGTPIYDDYSVLSRWWQKRMASHATHVALYYNTISLHDGNHLEGQGLAASGYAVRLPLFTAGLNRFLDDVQRSGRRVVVVFIPEHGAAVRGDRRQIQGLREIPTPAITHVPVGVMLINAARPASFSAQRIDSPTSYLAVNELLSRFIADNPFTKGELSVSGYTQNLPKTESLAENEGTSIMQVSQQFMMHTPDGRWTSWDAG